MTIRRVVCSLMLAITVGVFGIVGAVQKEGEAEALIKSANFLEQNPLDKQAKDMRKKALAWLITTDKVSVRLCSLIMNGVNDKYKYGDLFTQYTIGMAAYKLSNPDRASDEDAAQLAGVESALVAYESALKAEPKAKNAFMDDLIAKRADNTLAEYVKANNCKEKR